MWQDAMQQPQRAGRIELALDREVRRKEAEQIVRSMRGGAASEGSASGGAEVEECHEQEVLLTGFDLCFWPETSGDRRRHRTSRCRAHLAQNRPSLDRIGSRRVRRPHLDSIAAGQDGSRSRSASARQLEQRSQDGPTSVQLWSKRPMSGRTLSPGAVEAPQPRFGGSRPLNLAEAGPGRAEAEPELAASDPRFDSVHGLVTRRADQSCCGEPSWLNLAVSCRRDSAEGWHRKKRSSEPPTPEGDA